MTKFKFSVWIVLQLILIIAIFFFGLSLCNAHINLDKSARTTGIVTFANTKTIVAGRSGYFTGFLVQTKHDFAGYWLYRSTGDYNAFFTTIKPSIAVTIYHSTNQLPNGYFAIYQIQRGKSVIYAKEEYERKERLFGFLIVMPCVIVLLFSVFSQIKQRINERLLTIGLDC